MEEILHQFPLFTGIYTWQVVQMNNLYWRNTYLIFFKDYNEK